MWLFDDLIGNFDRHLNNVIVSPGHRLILIDNSRTFHYRHILVNDLNRGKTTTHSRFWISPYVEDRVSYPTRYPADFIARLRAITEKQIKIVVGRYLWGGNRDLILKRWALIIGGRLAEMDQKAIQNR